MQKNSFALLRRRQDLFTCKKICNLQKRFVDMIPWFPPSSTETQLVLQVHEYKNDAFYCPPYTETPIFFASDKTFFCKYTNLAFFYGDKTFFASYKSLIFFAVQAVLRGNPFCYAGLIHLVRTGCYQFLCVPCEDIVSLQFLSAQDLMVMWLDDKTVLDVFTLLPACFTLFTGRAWLGKTLPPTLLLIDLAFNSIYLLHFWLKALLRWYHKTSVKLCRLGAVLMGNQFFYAGLIHLVRT